MSTKELENLWWASLTHGGLLITPARLAESFSTDLEPLDRRIEERLRRDITRLSEDEKSIGQLLDTVFEQVLGMKVMSKESAVDKTWSRKLLTGEQFRPNRLWLGAHGDVFPIFVVRGRGEATPRLGVGRGRREVSKVLEWLRLANQKVGLLTNGQQFRLIHAGADYEAWCEWDTDFWFEEGRPGAQLEALRRLVHADVIRAPAKDKPSVLVDAILASRRGQAQLSGVLGERVRQAVETLIRASAPVIEPLLNDNAKLVHKRLAAREKGLESDKHPVTPNDVYIAATRIVMRLVVVLFAEARDLLPRDNPLYHSSYGLQGLREELDRAAGGRGNRLRQRLPSAWPRLLALFRLVSKGSGHEELPIPAYGGDLFAAGDASSTDGISRALAALESAENQIRDDVIHQVLDYLTRSPVKVRQGKASTVVMQPVSFSDLSSEYIGILYEGLLDYELKPVQASDGCMVFLNIGDEPALPISRLERMDEKALKSLFEKLKAKKADDEEEGDEEGEESGESDDAQSDADDDGGVDTPAAEESDAHREAVARVGKWAKKAVVAAGLVKVRKGREPEAADLSDAQRKLVRRVLPAGEWFLVRWGGTRKGAGTFYTRPQLASPTVRRTLQPLAYDVVREEKDVRTGLMEPVEWAPKKPEEILALKVCDPAMGSGSFLVSALRYLTQALLESLYHHGRLDSKGPQRTVCRLADGAAAGHPREELLPVPLDAPDFQERLRSRLKRHVVECCIYGVDLDPVAVELARLALWIETMNAQLPFEFLDHKLKCGNALVGCWFDRFQDYPIAAWERKGGDDAHTRFVHHFHIVTKTSGKNKGKTEKLGDKWDAAISEMAASRIYPELASVIRDQVQHSFTFGPSATSATAVHDDARKALEQMQRLAVHEVDRRAELYVSRYRDNEALRALRARFDAWCALWFWPGDRLELAPSPREFAKLSDASSELIRALANEHRFFHWELEFPDVFTKDGAGFDAVVGNPPWDIQKPNSKEFFSNYDPLYRAYGKQEALDVQSDLFKGAAEIEHAWIRYQATFKARSNWVKHSGRPFGDPAEAEDEKGLSLSKGAENAQLHGSWRQLRKKRKSLSDPRHPYLHQGSADINTYKMFLESAHALLRQDGRLGFIVPSGVYTDKGSAQLRTLFLNECRWNWLFSFENRDGIFDIHRSFKFAPVIVAKGGKTDAIRAAFMRHHLEDWEHPERFLFPLSATFVRKLSPDSLSIPEVSDAAAVPVLTALFDRGVRLGATDPRGWRIECSRELHMTDDSKLFRGTESMEEDGFKPSEEGLLVRGGTDVAVPLVQGVMLSAFNSWSKKWLHGSGVRAKWEELPLGNPLWRVQYAIGREEYLKTGKVRRQPKIGYSRIRRTTDTRTMMSAVLDGLPTGDSIFCIYGDPEARVLDTAALCGFLNSFVFDWQLRDRMGGTNVSWFYLEGLAVPDPASSREVGFGEIALSLIGHTPASSRLWVRAASESPALRRRPWLRLRAATPHERMRLRCILDAVAAELFGLTEAQFRWILRDCDLPVEDLRAARSSLDPKGFWRVDNARPPEQRHTVLAQVAYAELKRVGLKEFVSQNRGEGWTLPDELVLADFGLGRDDRAKARQPVASVFGPRWADWQQSDSRDESWVECERHARRLERLLPTSPPSKAATQNASGQLGLFGNPAGRTN